MFQDDTLHTSVMGFYHHSNPMAAAQPCCVADEMDSLVILYFAKGQAHTEELPGMIASSCKCR